MGKRHHRPPPVRSRQALDIQKALAIAVDWLRRGQLQKAEQLYRHILQIQPTHPDALHFLGVLLHQRGESAEAACLIEQAIEYQPDYADAHNNLGNILNRLGRYTEALAAYRRAIACRADFPEAYRNLGLALRREGQWAEATDILRQGIALKPDDADAHLSLARALSANDQPEEAIQAFQEGLQLNPRAFSGYREMGRVLYAFNRMAEAADCYRRWLQQQPDNPEAKHLLAAVTGEEIPVRAADGYVQALFDRFAHSFDQQLQRLQYQAPDLLAAAIATQWQTPNQTLRILDIGCGTGWCGPLLRPYASYLTGVDLSPNMVAKAQSREVYDELEVAELTAFMQMRIQCFDLIISADTFIYFGDLGSPLSAAANALRPGGLLAFTVERLLEDNAAGFRLDASGRYVHSQAYLERTLNITHLVPISIAAAHLRLERKEPVGGYVVLARKSCELALVDG